jgi:YspA, cpYpsA-related SLOG family
VPTTRILVCGGRAFGVIPDDCPDDQRELQSERAQSEQRHLFDVLDRLNAERNFVLLIHGDARGADRLAGEWAQQRGVPVHAFPADWDKHRRAAGPIRNKQMLDEGRPDLVVAFPGGRGTNNMVRQARAAGVEIVEIKAPIHRSAADTAR